MTAFECFVCALLAWHAFVTTKRGTAEPLEFRITFFVTAGFFLAGIVKTVLP